jgi:hypothetical protein
MNLKDSALGSIIRLNYPEHHQLVFEAGRPVRYNLGEGFAAVTGEVEFADGSHAWAVLELIEAEATLTGLGIILPAGDFTFDGYAGFFEKLGKNCEQVFPYRFRVLPATDTMPMLGTLDGWSRPQECDHACVPACADG